MKAADYKFTRKSVAVPDDEANGVIIRTLREFRDMTQQQLADALEISDAYLSEFERGKKSIDEDLFNRAKSAISKFKTNGK